MKQQTKRFLLEKLNFEEKFLHPNILLEEDMGLGHFDVSDLGDIIEEEFDVWVKLGDKNDWKTVGDIASYVDGLVADGVEEAFDAEESFEVEEAFDVANKDEWVEESFEEEEEEDYWFAQLPKKMKKFVKKELKVGMFKRFPDTKLNQLDFNAMQIAQKINDYFGIDVDPSMIKGDSTLEELLAYLIDASF